MAKKKVSVHLTYPGIVQDPEETETLILDELMRKFQSAKRYLRERIFEGYNRKEATNLAKPLFIDNTRYMRDAFLEAEASISSQKELLPTYIQDNERKIEKLKNQIIRLSTSNNKVEKRKYKESQLKKVTKQRDYFQYHVDHGTVPKMVDGSKQLFRELKNGKITKEEWRDKRSNAIYSRGEKSKGGNENIKLFYLGENLFEMRVLNPLRAKRGDRLTFTVRIPDKFAFLIASYLETGEAYSVRILRIKGKYEIRLSLESHITTVPHFDKGIAGVDMNPDNVAVTITYPDGNFRASKVFWMHDLNTVSANKRDWIIQNTVLDVLQWIKSFGIDTLGIEELKFLQQNKGAAFNRMASNFSFSSMTKAIVSGCFKANIALMEVKPYYSSFIGKMKYQQTYGLSIHQSAAFVLARRAMGFEEKIPKELTSVLFAKEAEEGQQLTDLFKHWKAVKKWHDDLLTKRKKVHFHTRLCFLHDFLILDRSLNQRIEVPFS
ncbi:hypothetical protein MUB24_16535 [Lederbergia sp. NSJ-179]|uniref:hypothetical protein n=1 Tax=Lederbergia sp. NSJ-179 TaxID=2931402 RepID=UPI001FD24954|nr:hypothetical protein [Lederbergia sp. NSJ-179]MCJ7842477.1 hypothetical protein [Lederbergia sp. NSJ-179]